MKIFSGNQLQNNNRENIYDLIKPPGNVAILKLSCNAAG